MLVLHLTYTILFQAYVAVWGRGIPGTKILWNLTQVPGFPEKCIGKIMSQNRAGNSQFQPSLEFSKNDLDLCIDTGGNHNK